MVSLSALRAATPEDAASIAHLVNSAYRGESSRAGWTTEADLLGGTRTDTDLVRATIAQPGTVILQAYAGPELMGCVTLERRGPACYLGMLTVRPEAQGKRLGKTILEGAEAYARQEFCAARMEMTVITHRAELIAWYERRGYRRTGDLTPFPSDPRFGILKVPSLSFERLEKKF